MSIDTIVSRLRKVNEELATISSLQRLKDMSSKGTKACTCAHHGSASRSRYPRKCGSHGSKDKSCRCRQRPKVCACDRTNDGQRAIESPKRSNGDDDKKSQVDYSAQLEPQKEVIEKSEKTNVRKLPDVTASDGDTARNDDGKPNKVSDSQRTAAASQTFDNVDRSEVSDIDKANDDKKNIEQMRKELTAEKKRNRELEEKLESTNCSLRCLKDEGEKQAACLKEALKKAKNQAKLASHSRNIAMDLANDSRDQINLAKANRDEIFNQINVLKCENGKLQCECEELRRKLRETSENEEKKFAEVDDKVSRIKCAVKQKELALASEKLELQETVTELTSHVKMQKNRICELTSICTKQRGALRQHEICISSKLAQLSEAENRIQSMSCRCGSLDSEIDELKRRLNEETAARCNLQKALDERRDNCNCELQIKDKIIDDQVETIKKLKKLLQDSERMAHQAAREFESLRDELHCLKQSNKSLRLALEEAEARMSDECEVERCERCGILEAQLCGVVQQKYKAVTAAKCAAEKLYETTMDYQRQLDSEKQQHTFVDGLLQRKEIEIELLKKELLHVKQFRSRRSNNYIVE